MIDDQDTDPTAAAPPPDRDIVTVLGEAEVGSVIGRYKIVDVLGEGGMGMVYAAEQEHPVRRRVALKIVKLGMDTKQVIARFEAERQALAMMDHPHVAQVYDAGTTPRGRPYFAMELVKGVPITEYCDTHRLTTEQRLKLFIPICQAIQHAHHKGVIHRDIKPSNVLVTIHDGVPVPKVIDFGIAKATSGRLTDKTLYTRRDQWIGTPEYMSPEQAEGSTLDIDTRSDVYSLGVLLYQLLTGTLPFEASKFHGLKYDDIRRILRDEEPPLPSTRFTKTGDATTTDIARRHHSDPRALRHELKGDLDWIIAKTLEKDRTRRYETANDLARDVQRHLVHEPVLASPPSAVYRFGKLVRRNKAVFAAGLVVFVALVLGLAVAGTGFFRAHQANERLQVALQETRTAKSRVEESLDRAVVAEALAEDGREQAEAARREAEAWGYTAALAAATTAVDRNDAHNARRHLEQTPEDLRGWEWRYLYHEADRSLGTELKLPRSPIGWSSALAPDATRVAVREIGSGAMPVGVFDLAGGERIVERAPEFGSNTNYFTFSNDGLWLAEEFAATPGVRIWSLAPDADEPVIQDWGLVGFLGFGPGSDMAAVSEKDTKITVFRLDDFQDVTILTDGWSNPARTGSFSPDGKLLAVGPKAGDPIRVFSIPGGEEVARFDEENEVVRVRFSADGSRMATLAPAGEIRVFDTAGWTQLAAIDAKALSRGDIAFMRVDHRLLLLEGGRDGMLRAYRADSGYLWWTQRGHSPGIMSIATDDTQGRILTAHLDGTVRSWDALRSGEPSFEIPPAAIAFSPDGTTVCFGTTTWGSPTTRAAVIWDVLEGRPLGALRLHPHTNNHSSRTAGLDQSPDRRRLAMVTNSGWGVGRLKVYDLDSGLGLFMTDTPDLRDVDWSGDGSVIAVCGEARPDPSDPTIRLFDGQSYGLLGTCSGHTKDVWSVAFSPDSSLLASAGEDGTVRIWNPRTRREIRVFGKEGGPSFRSLAFTADGARLVAGAQDGKLWVFDPLSESEPLKADAHSATINALAFLDQGRRLATGSLDKTVKLWDTESWRELVTLHFSSGVWSLAPSPDEARLAVGFVNGRLRILDAVDEGTRAEQRRVARDARRLVQPMVVDLMQRIDDPKLVRERIEQDTTLTEVMRVVALRELIVEREKTLAEAYDIDKAREIAYPMAREYIVREKIVAMNWAEYDLEPVAERIRQMPELTEAQREAIAEYAISLKGDEFRYKGASGWGHQLLCDVLHDGRRTSEDYAMALAYAEALVAAFPDRFDFQATLILALARMHELDAAREVSAGLDELEAFSYLPWAISWHAVILAGMKVDGPIREAAVTMARAAAESEPEAFRLQERFARTLIRAGGVAELTEVAGRLGEIPESDPQELNRLAWYLARDPRFEPPVYAAAAEMSRRAVGGSSDKEAIALYANTLGVALYRAGSHEEAIVELRRSDDLMEELESGRAPHNSAFIAMSLHRLGHTDEAANEYARLEQQLSQEQWAKDAEAVSFFNEARELLARE